MLFSSKSADIWYPIADTDQTQIDARIELLQQYIEKTNFHEFWGH